MDHDEALKIARIITHADGGCSGCVGDLMVRCQIMFPQHDWWDLVHEAAGEYADYRVMWETKEKFLKSVEKGTVWEDEISEKEGK